MFIKIGENEWSSIICPDEWKEAHEYIRDEIKNSIRMYVNYLDTIEMSNELFLP